MQVGSCQRELGQFRPAEASFRRALGILERSGAKQEPRYAAALDGLGTALSMMSSPEAVAPLRQALELRRALGEAGRHEVAHSLVHLAEAQENLGRYVEAEALYRQALELFTELHGSRHHDIAETQTALAQLLLYEGQPREAEALLLRAADFYGRQGMMLHPGYGRVLFQLGAWHQNEGNADIAEGRYRQALALRKILLGERHPEYVKSLHAVASLLSRQGQNSVALALHRRAMKLNQEIYGERSSRVAESLYSLAAVQLRLGNAAEHRTLLRQAVGMAQEFLGKDHPDLAVYSRGLAHGAAKGGTDRQGFLDSLTEALRVHELQVRGQFTAARLNSLIEDMEYLASLLYRMAMEDRQPAVQRLALRTALLLKDRAADATTLRNLAERRGLLGPETQKRIAAWRSARAELARLVYRGVETDPGKGLTQARQVEAGFARLKAARVAVERTEGELALASAELSPLQPPAGDDLIQAVAAQLPRDSALVEVVALPEQQIGALLLFPDQRIEATALGSEADLSREVDAFVTTMRDPKQDPAPEAQMIYRRLAPLFSKLGPARRVYLSLQGPLERLPWVALHDGERYLLDRDYVFISLSSGRELLRKPIAARARPGLILADPKVGQAAPPSSDETERRFFPLQDTIDLLGQMRALPALRGTGRDAMRLLPKSRGRVLAGAAATESALRQRPGPGLLHVVTHGVFWEERPRLKRDAVDPFLCCGLALAGASRASLAADAEADGVLTADEARDLDLAETELVVLALQPAGRGAVQAGKGALSMRQGFRIAGAETVVVNLWSVAEERAGGLMQRYYQKLLAGRPRVTALHEAMRETKKAQAHPHFWAPFFASGRDAPLSLGPARP
jgi:CHAT domain-containing protein/tetratricopeptide (TPR) repeat protein